MVPVQPCHVVSSSFLILIFLASLFISILTFLLKDEGCKKFTGYQADNYCKANGGRAVSLDSNEASEHFLDVSAQFAQRYYWTGGRLNHPCKTLYWPSGRSEGWEAGQRYWSPTGG